MIYDCFSFYNETSLLDLRLHELSEVVDKFVLVEATKTHSGQDKPLYFDENKSMYSQFLHKIIHIVVNDMPMSPEEVQRAITPQDQKWLDTGYQRGDNWVRERYQRNAIMRGLTQCYPDDIIIIEDADEFVRPEIVRKLESTMCRGSNAVQQSLCSYWLNMKCTNMSWSGSKVLRYKDITSPSEDRFHTPASCFIHDGGWHFNFMGGSEAIRQKIKAYAHQEFNVDDVLENVETRLANKTDVLGRLYQYKIVPIDETYPKYIRENLAKFDHMIYRE